MAKIPKNSDVDLRQPSGAESPASQDKTDSELNGNAIGDNTNRGLTDTNEDPNSSPVLETAEDEIPSETTSLPEDIEVSEITSEQVTSAVDLALSVGPEEKPTIEENTDPVPTEVSLISDTSQSNGVEAEIHLDAPPVSLHDRYELFPSKPLPELDSPSAKAFEARDQKGAYSNLFAIVCIPGFAVRVDAIEEIVGQRIPGILDLMDYGIIDWPLLGEKTPALVYERPTGGRLSKIFEEETSDYNKIEYMQTAVDGIIEGLEQLGNRGIPHRALRHDNIFFSDENREKVLLGDFVSTPAGFDQPVVYETIERGMADEGARGTGFIEDDMYAFGVTIASMVQNQLPIDGDSKEQIIISKIESSSFQTIVGNSVITPKVLGAMRGLLNDDPDDRWGFEELTNWRNGLPNTPKPSTTAHEAHRPLELDGYKHMYPRALAYSMSRRPDISIELINEGAIEHWVLKDFMDEDFTPTFAANLETARVQSRNVKEADDVLLAHVLMLLDPQAPIRYKDISYMPEAFGTALVTESVRGGDFRQLSESVTNRVPNIWLEMNEVLATSPHIERVNYSRLRAHLQKAGSGFGIERCIYELNWDFPCQSPLFENEYVLNVEEILPALNEAEKRVDPKTSPVDRHIAAFVAARVRKPISQFLQDIDDPDEAVHILGTLKLLASLQQQYGPVTLMGLSKWIGGQMGPVIKFYQSRSTQKVLETEVPKIVRNGNLNELLDLLDNPEARLNDEKDYEEAIEAFRIAQEEIKKIEHDMGPNSDKALLTSKQAASVTSIVIMTFSIVVLLIAG